MNKNTAWVILVAGLPGLPRCWHPHVLCMKVHSSALVAGTPTSYPTCLQVHLEAH